MANNLKDHLKEVADAIRAKKGTSDLINPQDFATEIEGISGGSGESGGSTESSWRYFKVPTANSKMAIQLSFMCKAKMQGMTVIIPSLLKNYAGSDDNIIACAMDGNMLMTDMNNGGMSTINEQIEAVLQGWISDGVVEITESEFYDLNA